MQYNSGGETTKAAGTITRGLESLKLELRESSAPADSGSATTDANTYDALEQSRAHVFHSSDIDSVTTTAFTTHLFISLDITASPPTSSTTESTELHISAAKVWASTTGLPTPTSPNIPTAIPAEFAAPVPEFICVSRTRTTTIHWTTILGRTASATT